MSNDFGDIGNLAVDAMTLGATAGMRGAKAQGDAAMATMAQQQADRAQALKFAEASPAELAQIERGIALNESDIARKQKLLDSSDPALIESGTQALKLLRGEEAKTLAPLRADLDKQEQALRSKLQAQLGTGYENTTAGLQALQAFNEQKNNALSGAQQNALGMLLGVAQNTSKNYGMQSNIANSSALSQLFGNISGRQVNALNGNPINAAAPFVGDIAQAGANQQFIGNAIKVGSAVASGGGTMFAGGTPSFSEGQAVSGNPYFTGNQA